VARDTTAAARKRRQRAHHRGDHTLCLPDRCPQAADAHAAEPSPPGQLAHAVRKVVTALGFAEDDPRLAMGELAAVVAGQIESEGAKAPLVRELRVLLGQIAEQPGESWDGTDEIRLRRAQRVLENLLRTPPTVNAPTAN
jgi:hypothetical protein